MNILVKFLMILVAVTALGLATPAASIISESAASATCLFAEEGCGDGTDECEYDCPGAMNCVPSGDPFEMCECENGMCETQSCDVIG